VIYGTPVNMFGPVLSTLVFTGAYPDELMPYVLLNGIYWCLFLVTSR
jgi:hypothetical protein